MFKEQRMFKAYLFDWGDTLMVDFPDSEGKMCDWPKVELVQGAQETLNSISKRTPIYIATSANESTENEIKQAFERVGLAEYISGYFCKENLGLLKGSPEFYLAIVKQLSLNPDEVIMVGDTIEKDIQPALEAGLVAIWFNPSQTESTASSSIEQITRLTELI